MIKNDLRQIQGDHMSGKPGKPGNVMEFQNWPKLSWKCHGKLKKLVKTWKCHGILKNKCRPGKFFCRAGLFGS